MQRVAAVVVNAGAGWYLLQLLMAGLGAGRESQPGAGAVETINLGAGNCSRVATWGWGCQNRQRQGWELLVTWGWRLLKPSTLGDGAGAGRDRQCWG